MYKKERLLERALKENKKKFINDEKRLNLRKFT